jgi:HK97 family phage major capsid protein
MDGRRSSAVLSRDEEAAITQTMKIPRTLYRTLSLDRAGINEAERTIELSISSEEPYRRSFGHEILDHSPHSVDMSKIMDGAPLLWNHDPDKHLGTIVSARIEGGKVRVIARIGENSDAEERWKDIKSGVLKKASVGYHITGMKKEGKDKDDVPTWRCQWCPHEATLTPLPADSTVGIGRSEETGGEIEVSDGEEQKTLTNENLPLANSLKNENKRDMATDAPVQEQKINVVEERNAAVAAERKRVNDIKELSGHFATNGLGGRKIDTAEVADQFIREGKNVEEFQNFVIRGNFKEAKPVETTTPELGLNKKEKEEYSFLRAIRTLASKEPLTGLEREASDAHAKLIGRQCGGLEFFIPQDIMRGAAFNRGISPDQLRSLNFSNEQTRALFTNVYAGAGAFVQDMQFGSMIELLRNQMAVVRMGARSLSGLKGNVPIPRQTGGATASWLAEDATATATQQTVGQLNLTPHKLMAATAYTQQLLIQSSIDIENFVRQDLMAVIALKRDLAAINGSGVAGEPLGILNTGDLSTSVTLSAAQSMTYANAVQFETNVSIQNAAQGKLGYLTTPTVKGNAKLIAEISSTNSNPVWKNDQVNGYQAFATNQVPTATSVIFGNFDDLILADWSDTSVLVDPYSLSLQSQIRVVMQMYCDNGIRHTKSFSVATN